MTNPKRYPLLLYREWMRPLRLPLFLLAFTLVVLYLVAFVGRLPIERTMLGPIPYPLLALAALAIAVLWGIVRSLPNAAFVECRPEYLLVQIAWLRLIVSYTRVRSTRTVQHRQIHPPAQQVRALRALAARMANQECVVLELSSYPMAYSLLRALAHPFFFIGEEPGFLFAVEEWMGLGRDVEATRSSWLARRKERAKPPRLGGLLG